jgi:hypothetical protein
MHHPAAVFRLVFTWVGRNGGIIGIVGVTLKLWVDNRFNGQFFWGFIGSTDPHWRMNWHPRPCLFGWASGLPWLGCPTMLWPHGNSSMAPWWTERRDALLGSKCWVQH